MISIIVPVYNAEAYIEDTIQMVLQQTYQDWELLLVDDGSLDGSAEVIRKYLDLCEASGRIRLICRQTNAGAASARNTGLDEAAGRYIAFLDADDIWRPEKLEKELAFMKHNDAGFVFTSYEFGNEDGIPTGKAVHVPKTLTYKEALSRTVIFTSTVLIDTLKIDKKLIRMPMVGSEDTAAWWNILRAGYTAYGLEEYLVIYRRPKGTSLSSDKRKAVGRIWNLYRNVEGLGIGASSWYFLGWAIRAVWRRIVPDWRRALKK
jgi:teichuronic acid biosynthesis glycosyltransferase TuaG